MELPQSIDGGDSIDREKEFV